MSAQLKLPKGHVDVLACTYQNRRSTAAKRRAFWKASARYCGTAIAYTCHQSASRATGLLGSQLLGHGNSLLHSSTP